MRRFGNFDLLSNVADSAGNALGEASTSLSRWFGGGEPAPQAPAAPAAQGPSLWDRFGEGIGDLGRWLTRNEFEPTPVAFGPQQPWWKDEVRQAPRKDGKIGPDQAKARSAEMGAALGDTSAWDERATGMGLQPGDGKTAAAPADAGGRWKRTVEGTPRPDQIDEDDGEVLKPGPTSSAKGTTSSKWAPDTEGLAPLDERMKAEFPLGAKYARENGRYFGTGFRRTKYMNDEERDAHRLGAEDGLLMRGDQPFDTQGAKSTGLLDDQYGESEAGKNIFALEHDVDRGASVYAADAAAEGRASKAAGLGEATHHSSFLSGAAVHGAGELGAKDGWLKTISNASGHHTPDERSNIQTFQALDAMGVNTDATQVVDFAAKEKFNARAYAASGGDIAALQNQKRLMSHLKTKVGAAEEPAEGEVDAGASPEAPEAVEPAPAAPAEKSIAPAPREEDDGDAYARGRAAMEGSDDEADGESGGGDDPYARGRAAMENGDDETSDEEDAEDDDAIDAEPLAAGGPEETEHLPPAPRGADLPGLGADAIGARLAAGKRVRMPDELEEGDEAKAAPAPAARPRDSFDSRHQFNRGWQKYTDDDDRATWQLEGANRRLDEPGEGRNRRTRGDMLVATGTEGGHGDAQIREWGAIEKTFGLAEPQSFVNENVPGSRRHTPGAPKDSRERVHYFNDDERAAHEVGVDENGLLTRGGGAGRAPIDTTQAGATNLLGSDAGRNIFALDRDHVSGQKLYAADVGAEREASLARANDAHARGEASTIDHVHHSSFTGGKEVHGAGDMRVKEGFLQRISNASGHYTPDARSNLQTLKALDGMGANLDTTMVETRVANHQNPVADYRARAVLATEDNRALMDAHKSTFAGLAGLGAGAKDDAVSPAQVPADLRGSLLSHPPGSRPRREAPPAAGAAEPWWKSEIKEQGWSRPLPGGAGEPFGHFAD